MDQMVALTTLTTSQALADFETAIQTVYTVSEAMAVAEILDKFAQRAMQLSDNARERADEILED